MVNQSISPNPRAAAAAWMLAKIADSDLNDEDAKSLDDYLHGWLTKALAIAAAFGSIRVGVGALSLLGNLGRIGAGGAVAGAGEGAAAGLLGLPAIIAAAVGAAIVWMAMHPEQVRKAVGAVMGYLYPPLSGPMFNFALQMTHSLDSSCLAATSTMRENAAKPIEPITRSTGLLPAEFLL